MSSLLQLCKALLVVSASVSLASCSLLDWFQSAEPLIKTEQKVQLPSGWSYSQQWQLKESGPSIPGVDAQTVTLTGQCTFSPELVSILQQNKKGTLLPALEIAEDFTIAPDLETSADLYRMLDKSLKLSGAGDSLELYQTVVASIEHRCPDNLNRNIDHCQFKKWLPFSGGMGSDTIYDSDRIAHWYRTHPSVDYLVMNSAGLYNSNAMLNSRYSKHSRVITEQPEKVRSQSVRPFLGRVQFDWVLTEKNNNTPFVSQGFCSVSWV